MTADADRLDPALEQSTSEDTGVRIQAAKELAGHLNAPPARARLVEMLDDRNIAVQIEAAEILTRNGGTEGLLAVLNVLGRRADDPSADYIAYKLYELEGLGEFPVLDTAASIAPADMTPEAELAVRNIKRLLGEG